MGRVSRVREHRSLVVDSARLAAVNAVAFICTVVLESEMRSISPGRLTYLGELTFEAYQAALAELVAAGR